MGEEEGRESSRGLLGSPGTVAAEIGACVDNGPLTKLAGSIRGAAQAVGECNSTLHELGLCEASEDWSVTLAARLGRRETLVRPTGPWHRQSAPDPPQSHHVSSLRVQETCWGSER